MTMMKMVEDNNDDCDDDCNDDDDNTDCDMMKMMMDHS